jgi:hypothetical protein
MAVVAANPILGIVLHAFGATSAALCYTLYLSSADETALRGQNLVPKLPQEAARAGPGRQGATVLA